MATSTPRITSVSPSQASPGDPVQLRGSNLDSVARVSVGGQNANIISSSSGEIWFEAPSGLGAFNPIAATFDDGSTASAPTSLRSRRQSNSPSPPPRRSSSGGGSGGSPGGSASGGGSDGGSSDGLSAGQIVGLASMGSSSLMTTLKAQMGMAKVGVQFIGDVVGGVGPSVHAALGEGQQIGNATTGLVNGAATAIDQAFTVGSRLGDTVLKGVLAPFGRSGSAIASLGSAVMGGIQGLVGIGLKGAASLVGTGASAIFAGAMLPAHLASNLLGAGSKAVGGVGNVVGGAVQGTLDAGVQVASLLVGLPGVLGSALGGITEGLGKAVTMPFQMLSSGLSMLSTLVTSVVSAVTQGLETMLHAATEALGFLGQTLGELGKVGGAALQTLMDVLSDVLGEAQKVAQQARELGAFSGAAQEQSFKAVNILNGLGLNTSALGGAFANQRFNALGSATGLGNPLTDPGAFAIAVSRALKEAQGNPMRGAQLQAQLDAYGPGVAQWAAQIGSLGPERISRIVALQKKFAPDSKQVAEVGANVQEAQIMASTFASNLKLTFAEALAPLFQNLLPKALQWLMDHKDAIVDAVRTVGTWIAVELPQIILRGGAVILHSTAVVFGAIGKFLQGGFQTMLKSLVSNLPAILSVLSAIINGLRQMAIFGAGIVSAIVQLVINFVHHPAVQAIAKTLGINLGGGGGGGQSPGPSRGGHSGRNQPAGNQSGNWYNPNATGGEWLRAGVSTGVAMLANTIPGVGPTAGAIVAPAAHWLVEKGQQAVQFGQQVFTGNYGTSPGGTSPGNPATTGGTGVGVGGGATVRSGGPGTPGDWSRLMPTGVGSVSDAFNNTTATLQANIPIADLSGWQKPLTDALGAGGKAGNDFGAWLEKQSAGIEALSQSLGAGADSYQREMLGTMREQLNVAKEHYNVAKEEQRRGNRGILAQLENQISTNAYLAATR